MDLISLLVVCVMQPACQFNLQSSSSYFASCAILVLSARFGSCWWTGKKWCLRVFAVLLLLLLLLLHPLNGLFSKTTSVSRHQKRKPSGAREDGVAVASAGPCANHLHLAPDWYHTSTSPLSFYTPDAFFVAQPTASKHWRMESLLHWQDIFGHRHHNLSCSYNCS